ncbi:MAG: hypothetical protein ACRCTJ_07110 [Brevinema sp.]
MLLNFDGRHIRSFETKDNFLSFVSFEDELKELAPYLFTLSADITISPTTLQKCYQLASAQKNHHYSLSIFYDSDLKFVFQRNDSSDTYKMSHERFKYWQEQFYRISQEFTLYHIVGIRAHHIDIIINFFEELELKIPDYYFLCDVIYEDKYIYIPFEFLNHRFLTQHVVKKQKNSIHARSNIHSFGMYFDPDLEGSYPESLKVLKLLEMRNFQLNQKTPNIMFVSAHGIIDEGLSLLQNQTLEAIIKDLPNPELIVFNSCLLSQEGTGIIEYFIKNNTDIIASPFYVPMEKTIFPALLRFFSIKGDFFTIFAVANLFNSTLSKYFRYITTKTP